MKHHFNVSNSYVIHKLKVVVFPWTHKSWSRRVHRSEQGQAEYQDPRDDINSPDLYIPRTLASLFPAIISFEFVLFAVMAFVTYVLISAFHSGLQSRFHPQVNPVHSRSPRHSFFLKSGPWRISIICPRRSLCRFPVRIRRVLSTQCSSQQSSGRYHRLLWIQIRRVRIIPLSIFKMLTFTCSVILTILSSYLYFSGALYYIIFFYFFFANGLFLLRSLRSLVLPDPAVLNTSSTATVSPGLRRRRITFLLIEAACQFVYMLWLVRRV